MNEKKVGKRKKQKGNEGIIAKIKREAKSKPKTKGKQTDNIG